MKETRKNIRLISLILFVCVILTAAVYVTSVYVNGSRWLNREINTRIAKARQTTVQGTVYDSEGYVLAQSNAPGGRHYINDETAFLALSHTLGDLHGKSEGGIQVKHATTLLGMDDLTGAGATISSIKGETFEGNDIVLTLSSRLTRYMYTVMPKDKNGACVVINYKTGEILGKVSLPAYDIENVDAYSGSEFIDRVTQARYAPGSTGKIVTLAAALEKLPGVEYDSFTCGGRWTFAGSTVKCAGGTVHGALTLRQAFAKSCNTSFASLAYQIGARDLKTVAEDFGFNYEFAFDDVILYSGRYLTKGTDAGDVMQAGFGQGTTEVTPLHMAMIAGAIANGGDMMVPRIIKEVRRPNGITISTGEAEVFKTVADADTCLKIAEYMYCVVKEGTGTRAAISGYTVCGKTGSAETSNDKTAMTNAWYTGFIYGDPDHPYAIAVIIEKGGSGGETAAPIAAKVLKKAIELGL